MEIQFRCETLTLQDYLLHLFPKGEDGLLKVDGCHGFGCLLIAHSRTLDTRPPEMEGDNVVTLSLPKSESTQDLQNRWLYYSSADIKRLNIALKAYFDLDLEGYYRKAERLGFKKKEAVEAFILSRGLSSVDTFDAMHKRIYRKEQEKMAQMTKVLLRKVYYINETIDPSGLIR